MGAFLEGVRGGPLGVSHVGKCSRVVDVCEHVWLI